MALLAGLLRRQDEVFRDVRAVGVVAHPATRQLVCLVAVRMDELLLPVARLAASAETKPASTTHAVAVGALDSKGGMVDEWCTGIPWRVSSRVEPDFVISLGGFKPQHMMARQHLNSGVEHAGEEFLGWYGLTVQVQLGTCRLGNDLDFLAADPCPVPRLDYGPSLSPGCGGQPGQ